MINRADFDDFVTKKETEAEVPKRFQVTDLMQKSSALKSALCVPTKQLQSWPGKKC